MTKFTKFFIKVFVFIVAIPVAVLGQEMTKKEKYTVVGFRTVHLINLKTAESLGIEISKELEYSVREVVR